MLHYYKKSIFLLLTLLIVSNCGFHSIYNDKIINESNISLNAIKINQNQDKNEQRLRIELEKTLNPEQIDVNKKYILDFEIKKQIQIIIINKTGASGKNRITLNVKYKLKDIEYGDIISSGSVYSKDTYDVQNNRFANYIAEEEVERGLLRSISQNIRDFLIRDLNKYESQQED